MSAGGSSADAALRVRRMRPADVEQVMKIERSLPGAPGWPEAAYWSALDPQSTPSRIALVAEEGESGGLEGYLVAGLLAPQAELETIAVAAKSQRRGVGGRLFAALAGELRTERVTEVILEVRASNRQALGFYRSLGFAETGRRPRYYADPEEDALLLALELE